MKKILTIILLAPLLVKGQQFKPLSNLTDTNTITTGFLTSPSDPPHKDTVKVLMLVCDTANQLQKHNGWLILDNVYWQFGYQVHEQTNYFGSDKWYFLDENKKPLRRSVIVWDVKLIHN